jgi:hypothetical protein
VFFFFFSFSPTCKTLILGFLLLLLLKKKKKKEGLAEDYLKQARKERDPFSLLTCLVLCELGFFFFLGGFFKKRELVRSDCVDETSTTLNFVCLLGWVELCWVLFFS